jgi:hypothetical protein
MISRRQIPGLILLPALALVPCVYAADSQRSLILVEYGKDSRGAQTQTLVRYHFSHGVMVGKESILTSNTFDLRYDIGPNLIYEDRYVITAWGDVVDLVSQKALFKSDGELVGIDRTSSSVIIRVNRDESAGIYAFDLATRRYRRVKQPNRWAMPGTISPNGRLSAVGEGAKIWLHRLSGKKVLLGRDFGRVGTPGCSSLAVPTFVWLDDRHLLTQRGNGRLFVVDVEGRIEPLVTIEPVTPPPCGPEIRRDRANQILYDTAENAWLIDAVERSVRPYLWEPSGDGFELEYLDETSQGLIVRYHGKNIGQWWCADAVTAPGHIAMKFGPVGSNLGYPKGVKVWSAESGAWTTIEPEWLAALIGWIEK